MSNVSPETAPFFTHVVGQLLTAGTLVAIQLQSWLVLRLTNPVAAYLKAAVHAAALGRGLQTQVARCSTARHRDRTR